MYVAELTYPGTWIVSTDDERKRDLTSLFLSLESHLTQAAVALHLFEQARLLAAERLSEWASQGPDGAAAEMQKEGARRQELMRGFARIQYGIEGTDVYLHADFEALDELAQRALKREKWNAGTWPETYDHELQIIHAKSFALAFAAIKKLLDELSKLEGERGCVKQQRAAFDRDFPALMGVRDSLQHPEHRDRGLDRNGKPLKLRTAEPHAIWPGVPVLALNNLHGDSFRTTVNDGSYAEIEVNRTILGRVQKHLQATIDCFEWGGPKRHYPS